MKLYLTLLIFSFCIASVSAQIGVDTNDPKATLDIVGIPGTDTEADGVLIPRLTLAELDAKMGQGTYDTPQNGVLVYVNDVSAGSGNTSTENITEVGFYYYNHPTWFTVGENKFWSTTGNSDTNDNENFIGTTDDEDLIFKVGNVFAGRIPHSASNLYIGLEAGVNNDDTDDTSGSATDNTGIGYAALSNNTSGRDNTAIGNAALAANTIGFQNTAVGDVALAANIESNANTAMGFNTLANHLGTEGNNTAYGFKALEGRELPAGAFGRNNTAVGTEAIGSIIGGRDNSALGFNAMAANTFGDKNTAIGESAMRNNINGDNNTAIGAGSFNADGVSNSTAIGYDAQVSGDNYIAIGNTTVEDIEGQVMFGTFSDGRFKINVKENIVGLDFIKKLRPVSYNWDMDALAKFRRTPDSLRLFESERIKSKEVQNGFIAQEVSKAAEDLNFNFYGISKPKNENSNFSLRYAAFVVPIVKAIQEQQDIIESQNKKLDRQSQDIEDLKKMIKKQQEQINLLLSKRE